MKGEGQNQDAKSQLLGETIPRFKTNMKAIKLMIPLLSTAERCVCITLALFYVS